MDNERHAIENTEGEIRDLRSNSELSALLTCPTCGRAWQQWTEQAACIRLFSGCIVCRVEKEVAGEIDYIGVTEIQAERSRYILAG